MAGFCTTVVASPVDVVKTRFMNSKSGQYKGAIDCAVRMMMQEGPAAFYKGFVPSFSRLVSWNICMWITYMQLGSLHQDNIYAIFWWIWPWNLILTDYINKTISL